MGPVVYWGARSNLEVSYAQRENPNPDQPIRIRVKEVNRRRSHKCEARVTTSFMLFPFLSKRFIAGKKTVVLLS